MNKHSEKCTHGKRRPSQECVRIGRQETGGNGAQIEGEWKNGILKSEWIYFMLASKNFFSLAKKKKTQLTAKCVS